MLYTIFQSANSEEWLIIDSFINLSWDEYPLIFKRTVTHLLAKRLKWTIKCVSFSNNVWCFLSTHSSTKNELCIHRLINFKLKPAHSEFGVYITGLASENKGRLNTVRSMFLCDIMAENITTAIHCPHLRFSCHVGK